MEGFREESRGDVKNKSKSGLHEAFLFASGLIDLAEEEVQGWVRKLIEKRDVNPEESTRLFNEVKRWQHEATVLIEQWLEERIRGVSRTFPIPFQTEISQLQKRMRLLRERAQALSEKLAGSGRHDL